jgi:myosin-1
MLRENRDMCILISGESGAGKTEGNSHPSRSPLNNYQISQMSNTKNKQTKASKYILEYIAATSSQTSEESASTSIGQVKRKLIQSNDILEAFGNAKTVRNNNSSRYGKYMDIRFDYKGWPNGGCILNYLLEKSRVVYHAPRERNFHIFYHLLTACTSDERLAQDLRLTRHAIGDYRYLRPDAAKSSSISAYEAMCAEEDVNFDEDRANFEKVDQALLVCDFTRTERRVILVTFLGLNARVSSHL